MDQHQQRLNNDPPPPPPGGDASGIATLAVIAFVVITMLVSRYPVPKGHVGCYWRVGALLKEIIDPGFHLKLPLITNFEPIQATLQTDLVRVIPCGTKGRVMISFDKIEVVNRLRKEHVCETL